MACSEPAGRGGFGQSAAAHHDPLLQPLHRYDFDLSSAIWSDWTGFSDQAAYERANLDAFAASRKATGSQGELQDLCEAEQENACGGS